MHTAHASLANRRLGERAQDEVAQRSQMLHNMQAYTHIDSLRLPYVVQFAVHICFIIYRRISSTV